MSLDLGGEAPCYAHLLRPPELAEDAAVALLHDLSDALLIADRDGRIVFWNAASERLFGWPAEDVLDRTFDVIIPVRHRARLWDAHREFMTSRSTTFDKRTELQAVDRDGVELSISLTLTPVRARGAVTGIAVLIRDETERRDERRRLERRVAILDRQPGVLPL